jgi:hypothetical protein
MNYPYERPKSKFFLFFIVFIILIIIAFFVFGDRFTLTRDLKEKVLNSFSSTKTTVTAEKTFIMPPTESDWCKIQELNVDSNMEEPVRDRIVGWDDSEQCCVRRVDGYNCALHRESYTQYCDTGNVGGRIVWAMVDGYYINNDLYKAFIEDLDKVYIENKPCAIDKYPEVLK